MGGHVVDQGAPSLARGRLVQTLEQHQHLEAVAGPRAGLLAPVRVEQPLGVEVDEARQEALERRVGGRPQLPMQHPEVGRQGVGAQGQPRHHAEGAAAPALQRPEQVRLADGVDGPDHPVGGDDLRLQKAGRGEAVGLGEAAEASALDQPRHAHRGAAAALDVAAALGSHRLVDVSPDAARAHGHGSYGRLA